MNQPRQQDINELVEAAREAMASLRRNAELLESASLSSEPQRALVRRLNMAIQMVEHAHQPPDPDRYYEG